jgi:hypothetical protein
VARWSDNPLSALNLGGSQGKLEAAQSGKGGVQGSVSSESAGDSQFPLSDDLLEDQRKTREQEQQQLKRKNATLLDSSSDSDSDDIFAEKPTSTPGNPKPGRAATAGHLPVHHEQARRSTSRLCRSQG